MFTATQLVMAEYIMEPCMFTDTQPLSLLVAHNSTVTLHLVITAAEHFIVIINLVL